MDNRPFVLWRSSVRWSPARVQWTCRLDAARPMLARNSCDPLDLGTDVGDGRPFLLSRLCVRPPDVRKSNSSSRVDPQPPRQKVARGSRCQSMSNVPDLLRCHECSPSVTGVARVGHAPHPQPVHHVWITRPRTHRFSVPSVDNQPHVCEREWTTPAASTPRTGGPTFVHRSVCGVITHDRSGTSSSCPHCQQRLLRR